MLRGAVDGLCGSLELVQLATLCTQALHQFQRGESDTVVPWERKCGIAISNSSTSALILTQLVTSYWSKAARKLITETCSMVTFLSSLSGFPYNHLGKPEMLHPLVFLTLHLTLILLVPGCWA